VQIWSPKQAIITTRLYSSSACAGPVIVITNNLNIIAWVMMIFVTIISCDLLDVWRMHDLHYQCMAHWHGNLKFSHLFSMWITIPTLSFPTVQNYILHFLSIFFVTNFLFRSTTHPVWLEKLPRMSAELRISSSLFLQCPRVCPCECGCIHEDTLNYWSAWWIQLFCGWKEHLWINSWVPQS
jgi:hypothetical protein